MKNDQWIAYGAALVGFFLVVAWAFGVIAYVALREVLAR